MYAWSVVYFIDFIGLLPDELDLIIAKIDLILIKTVVMEDFGFLIEKRDRMGQFLVKLTSPGVGEPAPREYYAEHIKNIATFARFLRTTRSIVCWGYAPGSSVLSYWYQLRESSSGWTTLMAL